MAWLLYTDLPPAGEPGTRKFDQPKTEALLAQFSEWQGNVNGGGYTLSNVILSTNRKATWSSVSGGIYQEIGGPAGTTRFVEIQTAGAARWRFGGDSDTESGGNTGTPFVLKAYNDSGSLIGNAIIVQRPSRWVTFSGGLIEVSRISAAEGGQINLDDATRPWRIDVEESGSLRFFSEHPTVIAPLVINGGGRIVLAGLGNYANDSAAAAGGVPVNGVYRNGNALYVRVS